MRAILALVLAMTITAPAIAATAATPAPMAASAPQAALVDLNRASLAELIALKGIGEVRAAAIVKGRPYARKDELVRRGIVPQSVYDEIREQIIARQ